MLQNIHNCLKKGGWTVTDIEMMLYSSQAWGSALNGIDRKNKYSGTPEDILKHILSITDRIGYLKLTSIKYDLNLQFKKKNKNGEVELPAYEKKIINESGEYTGDDNLIKYIYDYSKSLISTKLDISIADIKDLFVKECKTNYSSEHLSNGHDLSYLMSWMLKKVFKMSNQITTEYIESNLCSAYSFEYLRNTRLFYSMISWSNNNKRNLFIHNLNDSCGLSCTNN